MENNGLVTYFLTANSGEGFVNGFSLAYNAQNGWKVYLIKGGPGTGKSTFMKNIAQTAVNQGITAEVIPCSSDPNSLDGVILPQRKIAVFDATAPHCMDPIYPGVCEEILNFGQFWKDNEISAYRKEVIDLTNQNKALHKKASKLLSVMGSIKNNEIKTVLCFVDIDKTFNFAVNLAKRYIKPKGQKSTERIWYLSAVTPNGNIFLKDTINMLCSEKIAICDSFAVVSNMMLSVIRDYALSCGMNIITVKNNILPSSQIDHILIPELSLAFISSKNSNEAEYAQKRIHCARFMNRNSLKESRSKLLFGKRLYNELNKTAVETLHQAKLIHDQLESYYINAMDFEAVKEYSKDFCSKKLFKIDF